MQYVAPLSRLIEHLRSLPGIGPKTAVRLAYHVLEMDKAKVLSLTKAIVEAKEQIHRCSVCYNLTDEDPCRLCSNNERDQKVVCVVEQPQDVVAMERTHNYNGLYHVLHGALSPLDGVGPDQIRIKELLARLHTGTVQEVIMATNSDVEGEATAMYVAKLLKMLDIKVTRIAHGLPVGGDIEYADEVTLSKALENRREL